MKPIAALALALWPLVARAEAPTIISAAPDTVAVTVYRDPDRGNGSINRNRPAAFALIAETRTVTLPPGEATVRFEGVASGIVPQSAILFGTDPRERNRDAALLSKGGLVDAFTGQQVILRRTDRATGKTSEELATVRSAADRLVVQTETGVEALHCTGLNQTLIYPHAPPTLSAKPVLSMTTREQAGGTITITLAYIATGFDWDASYVVTLAPDGKTLSLLGWLTLASADQTSFVDATTSTVAGRINRAADTRGDMPDDGDRVAARQGRLGSCWPAGRTSDPYEERVTPPPVQMLAPAADYIIVTAQRRSENPQSVPIAVTAQAESLGDLKLYRVPVPVTVAARSQKQVAFLTKDRVVSKIVYRSIADDEGPGPARMLVRLRNRKRDGLGEPLPAGKAILYQDSVHGPLLVGESATTDKAVDEEVELTFAESSNLMTEATQQRLDDRRLRHAVTVRNANPFPVSFELEFREGDDLRFDLPSGRVIEKPGRRVWASTIPANGMIRVGYSSFHPAE